MLASFHHHNQGNDLQTRVDELIRKYRRPHDPTPVMVEILNNSSACPILVAALRRQVSLIKCRSQAFEDCQITVYDRALLVLSNYGESLTDYGALELYLTEYLGIVPIAPVADSKDAVMQHVELENVLKRVRATHEGQAVAGSMKQERTRELLPPHTFDIHAEYERHLAAPLHSDDEEPRHITALGIKAREVDIRVTRLLDVYQKAKDDYFRTKARDGVDSLEAIRFLRDSAENTLRYFQANGLSNHGWVPDLEHTFIMARDKTTHILGGRSRHFEDENRRTHVRAPTAPRRHFDEDRRVRKYNQRRTRRIIDSYRPGDDY
ncbi:hypothetical protein BJY04DRAFT_220750 [Aspergillus karnatakaensis]|uniref:uncharacterized protein n=1 Tax=Aspergillus karnatakaensis TaxID=1810916 RepID=UPI003CCD786A